MLKTIWMIILLVILVSSIWRRMERAGWGTAYREPKETLPEVTYGEGGRKLNLPGYITGRDSEPVVPERKDEPGVRRERIAAARRPLETEQPGWEAGEINLELPGRLPPTGNLPGQALGVVPRERCKERTGKNCFTDIQGPGQVLQGIVWSEILGPRGGIWVKRKNKR